MVYELTYVQDVPTIDEKNVHTLTDGNNSAKLQFQRRTLRGTPNMYSIVVSYSFFFNTFLSVESIFLHTINHICHSLINPHTSDMLTLVWNLLLTSVLVQSEAQQLGLEFPNSEAC